jgi:hypothetical protein
MGFMVTYIWAFSQALARSAVRVYYFGKEQSIVARVKNIQSHLVPLLVHIIPWPGYCPWARSDANMQN